jgi:glycosyltransferase involved in cell wall biosynthesis
MSLASLKTWVKAQRWLQPVMPVLRLGVRVQREIVSIPRFFLHPRYWIKSKPYLRPFIPLFRLLETLVFLFLMPIRAIPFLYHLYWFHQVGRKRLRVPAEVPGPRRIVMLVATNLAQDPRVRREAQALAQAGFPVTIICPAWTLDVAACAHLDWGANITFRILPMKAASFIRYYPHLYGRQMFQAALAEDAWAYHAHDLDMSFLALLAAARKEVACVCDFHEWYSENITLDPWTDRYHRHPFFKRRLYRAMERLAIHHATRIITVCQSIGTLLEQTYQAPRPITIVRNIPDIHEEHPETCEDLRAKLGIAPEQKIVLYQGGMGPSRNLEPVIRAIAHAPRAVFVIRGPGHLAHAEKYYKLARSLGIEGRVFCLPPVPAARVVAEARAADAGLWTLLSNVGLNFKLALPNKVFEYLAAGIPLLVADLPEVRAIVDTYQVGLCFDPDDQMSIATCINRLFENAFLYTRYRDNIGTALNELRADQEWNKLVDVYRHLAEANEHVTRLARAG